MSPALVFPGRKAAPSSILSASADEFVPAFACRRLWGDMVAVVASGSHRSAAANSVRLTCTTATHLAIHLGNRAVWVERYVLARELSVTPVASCQVIRSVYGAVDAAASRRLMSTIKTVVIGRAAR